MNRLKFIAGVTFALACATAMAQGPILNATTSTTTDVEGSPYMNENFVNGEIYFGKSKSSVPVRYNIYQDLMEYKQNGLTLSLDGNNDLKKINLSSLVFVRASYEYKGKSKTGYLVLLDSGKATLLAKKRVVFDAAKKGGGPGGTNLGAVYTELPDVYFYQIGDSAPKQIDNLKSMIAGFPDHQEQLTLYAKQEKINARKEKGLMKLVEYYNFLQGSDASASK